MLLEYCTVQEKCLSKECTPTSRDGGHNHYSSYSECRASGQLANGQMSHWQSQKALAEKEGKKIRLSCFQSHRYAFRDALALLDNVEIIKPLPLSDILFQFTKVKIAQVLRCYLFTSIAAALERFSMLLRWVIYVCVVRLVNCCLLWPGMWCDNICFGGFSTKKFTSVFEGWDGSQATIWIFTKWSQHNIHSLLHSFFLNKCVILVSVMVDL